ncbi:MAG: glycosyltransferase family 2 protein [Pseudomonadota bacterium]
MAPIKHKASIIVLTYNRPDALFAVLYGLAHQILLPWEVIISDDGSTSENKQATLTHLQKHQWPFKIKYLWHPDIGFTASRARNQGVFYSSGNYVILLDGDCVPRRDFIFQHLHIARGGAFVNGSRILLNANLSNIVISSPQIVENHSFYWMLQKVMGKANKWPIPLVKIPNRLRKASASFHWKGIRSCNFSLWRSDFDKINGFDESFVGWGHEDADFVWRLQRTGCRRINGFWATEVFHLWHQEASRDRESANASRLHERMTRPDSSYLAARGIKDSTYDDCELVYAN